MTLIQVKSSHIRAVGHDPVTKVLTVRLANGTVYHYDGVNAADHAALTEAESIGRHFNAHIRNKFPYRKGE